MQEQNNLNNNVKNEKNKKIIGNKNMNSFYYKFGYKYTEFNFFRFSLDKRKTKVKNLLLILKNPTLHNILNFSYLSYIFL